MCTNITTTIPFFSRSFWALDEQDFRALPTLTQLTSFHVSDTVNSGESDSGLCISFWADLMISFLPW